MLLIILDIHLTELNTHGPTASKDGENAGEAKDLFDQYEPCMVPHNIFIYQIHIYMVIPVFAVPLFESNTLSFT